MINITFFARNNYTNITFFARNNYTNITFLVGGSRMNDRFKFRFWRKNVQGKCVQESADLMSIDGSSEPYDNGGGGAVCYFPDCCICEQCTGLKDKNGKLIYENDIVTDGKEVGRIYWYKTGWAVTMFLWQHDISELEVIGNIHENPELLEEEA